ncbi:aminoglycoside 6'-N-acetyltransferase [Proteinivorax tanatarense]|uniref:Aminoglycoside N(6')-acetyltransferase type 1 n=1 Tax=Proteinivorax tanatarense TaxID=1260629 RepID=A0AAU7VK14_9FIRM
MGKIIKVNDRSIDSVTELAMKLWPDNDYQELKEEFAKMLHTDNNKVFLYLVDGNPIGFAHFSIRTDYVEGSDSSPIGYIEGIYVEAEYRRQEVSKELLAKGEQWVKEKGYSEIASSCEYDNTTSYHFHKGIGFKEANRIICFIKDVK